MKRNFVTDNSEDYQLKEGEVSIYEVKGFYRQTVGSTRPHYFDGDSVYLMLSAQTLLAYLSSACIIALFLFN